MREEENTVKEKNNSFLYFVIALIVVLFMTMLVLCGMYLDLRVNGVTSSLPGIPENDKWILTDSGYNAHSSTGQLISPAFMGVKAPSIGMIAATYNKDSRKEFCDYYESDISALFRGTIKQIKFAGKERKNEYIKNLINSDMFMFMSFYKELPAASILPGLYGNSTVEPLKTGFFVKYMFIVPYGDTVKGICFDKNLDAHELYTNETIGFDQSHFYAYNMMSGWADFEFISEINPEPVFTSSFNIKSAVIAPSFSFYKFNLDNSNTLRMLKNFGFNTNLVKVFSSNEKRTVSFVGEEKELYVSLDNEKITYNGKIHLSEYLKYQPQNGTYTFNDKVLCVKYMVNSIDRILVGGDARPAIIQIANNDGEPVFRLKYFYNGVAVTERLYDVSVSIQDEYINNVEINALFCDSGNIDVPVIPQKLALAVFDESQFENGFAGCSSLLRIDPVSGNTELVWGIRKDVE